MAQAQSTLSHLSEAELKTLLARVAGFALYKLGSRIGHGPEMHPEDLTHQAFADTLTGRRHWNREIHTIVEHLTATVSSYISHYFDSLAAKNTSHTNQPDTQAADPITPEHTVSQEELAHRIRSAINIETDPLLRETWHLFETEGWDLKKDSEHFCQRLGLDATTGSADYQRFNRVRNRIRSITRTAALNEMQQSPSPA